MADSLRREKSQAYLLLSIAFSHFNEKARWAFSYYRVPYAHHLLLPWLHIFTIKPIVDSQVCTRESRDTASSPFSTPCLAVYDASGTKLQESFHDSHDILNYLSEKFSSPEHVNLYTSCGPVKESEIYGLEKHYDEVLGKAVIDFFYFDIVVMNKWRAMLPFACVGFRNRVGVLQSLVWFGLSPLLGRGIISVLDITSDRYEKAMENCREEFRRASECKFCICSIASHRQQCAVQKELERLIPVELF
jgi:glutathione S-transferase